jgi:lipoyl(octanoyl) transferase
MEQWLIDVLSEYQVLGIRVPGRSGVWVDTRDGIEKVAAIGIRVSEHHTMHGFALNCNNSLDPYETIVACGISDAKTTTLSKLVGREISPSEVLKIVKAKFQPIESNR